MTYNGRKLGYALRRERQAGGYEYATQLEQAMDDAYGHRVAHKTITDYENCNTTPNFRYVCQFVHLVAPEDPDALLLRLMHAAWEGNE